MNTADQTYIITGAAGFIGSNICKELLSRSETKYVIGLDNINDYYSPKIKRFRLSNLQKNKKFIFYENSILNTNDIENLILTHKPKTLIHTAAEVGVTSGENHPLRYFSTNVLGTLSVLEACKKHIQHAILFSSSSVYGDCGHFPYSEREALTISSQISTYGASKLSMEIAAKDYFMRTGVPLTIIRPFSVYGPNGRPDMLPIKMLISAKKNTPFTVYSPHLLKRDWTYIDDFMHMFKYVIGRPHLYQVINIGSGKPIFLHDILKIAKKTLSAYNVKLQYTVTDVHSFEMIQTHADIAFINALIPKSKHTSFEYGFMKTAEFFFNNLNLYE